MFGFDKMFHVKQSKNFKKGENMELTITEAREELVTIVKDFNDFLTTSQKTAILLADQALKTIADMKGETKDD